MLQGIKHYKCHKWDRSNHHADVVPQDAGDKHPNSLFNVLEPCWLYIKKELDEPVGDHFPTNQVLSGRSVGNGTQGKKKCYAQYAPSYSRTNESFSSIIQSDESQRGYNIKEGLP